MSQRNLLINVIRFISQKLLVELKLGCDEGRESIVSV